MVGQVASKLQADAQSGDVVDLLNEFMFKATQIPPGGVTHGTTSSVKKDALRKDSVNVIETQTKTASGTHE